MTPDPEARSTRIKSAVRGTRPSAAAYEVVKIWTTDGPTRRAVDSSVLLRSAAVGTAAARVWAKPDAAVRNTSTEATAGNIWFRLTATTFLGSKSSRGSP